MILSPDQMPLCVPRIILLCIVTITSPTEEHRTLASQHSAGKHPARQVCPLLQRPLNLLTPHTSDPTITHSHIPLKIPTNPQKQKQEQKHKKTETTILNSPIDSLMPPSLYILPSSLSNPLAFSPSLLMNSTSPLFSPIFFFPFYLF